MMYATCAHPGCYGKISYQPEQNIARPRYCTTHMHVHADRHGIKIDCLDDDRIYIMPTRIRNRKKDPDADPVPQTVIMICIKCKRRTTWSKERWLSGDIPECCKRKMIYHKDNDVPAATFDATTGERSG